MLFCFIEKRLSFLEKIIYDKCARIGHKSRCQKDESREPSMPPRGTCLSAEGHFFGILSFCPAKMVFEVRPFSALISG